MRILLILSLSIFCATLNAQTFTASVVESAGLVSLLRNSSGYYVDSASLPITNGGNQVNDLSLPGWLYLGVEASTNPSYAYDLLLRDGSSDLCAIWNLDASGARVAGELITPQQLRSYEIAFAQDLDGDGQIGN